MAVTETGVPVDSLIDAVEAAVQAAGISTTDRERTVRVTAIQLVPHAVATSTTGAKPKFTIPFVGMEVRLGTAIARRDTHTVDITLVPPDLVPAHEIRDGNVDHVLVEAIETVTAVVAHAAGGDDPFLLKESTVELCFAVTRTGSISLGLDGETGDDSTHTLKITLAVN